MDQIAVIIPCYKVKAHIVELLSKFGQNISRIYLVDDRCPEKSGKFVQENCTDPRVKVIFNEKNLGVGGAVKRGFQEAAQDGFTYLVKVDGDGQMDPADIQTLIKPLQDGHADYVKANRFFNPRYLRGMPPIRLFGNGVLSFLTKLSSGYWHLMDPTNGFIAIHSKVFMLLEHEKIENRYFFETDMLYRLHLLGAVVQDVPIPARYSDEESNLKISNTIVSFTVKHMLRMVKRVVYDYFVRDFNVGSAQLVFGLSTFSFGMTYGLYHWLLGALHNRPSETGTIIIAFLLTIVGFQLLLSALHYDISNRFTNPIHKFL
jgi:glycosyltransferase involved in cell wall biosynthesis